MAELLETSRNDLREEEPGLLGIGAEPPIAIGQRALLVQTPHGNVLWDCVPVLDDPTRETVESLGGIAAICMSHPHFYASHVDWADAFDATIHIPRADEQWIRRRSPRIELFDDAVEPVAGPRDGPHRRALRRRLGAALAGRVGRRGSAADRGHDHGGPGPGVGQLMWSFPNLIPLDEHTVLDIAARVERLRFDRVYGGWWGAVVVTDGAAAVRRSADRYVARLRGERPAQNGSRLSALVRSVVRCASSLSTIQASPTTGRRGGCCGGWRRASGARWSWGCSSASSG